MRLGILGGGLMAAMLLVGCTSEATPPDGVPPSEVSATAAAEDDTIVLDGISVPLPEGYIVTGETAFTVSTGGTVEETLNRLSVGSYPSGGQARPLEVDEADALDTPFDRQPAALDPVRIDGVEMFHVAGQVDDITWLEGYGVTTEDHQYSIDFLFDIEKTPDQRRAVIDSVLAGVRLE